MIIHEFFCLVRGCFRWRGLIVIELGGISSEGAFLPAAIDGIAWFSPGGVGTSRGWGVDILFF